MEEILKKYEELFKLYNEVYKEGLVGISCSEIQVSNSTFGKIAIGRPLTAQWVAEYFQVSAEINEVTYITLVK